MNDKLKAIEYNLIIMAKSISQLNYSETNYLIEDALNKIYDLMCEISDAIECIEIIIEDEQLNTSSIS